MLIYCDYAQKNILFLRPFCSVLPMISEFSKKDKSSSVKNLDISTRFSQRGKQKADDYFIAFKTRDKGPWSM